MVIDGTVVLLPVVNALSLVGVPAKRVDRGRGGVDALPATRVAAFEVAPLLHWRERERQEAREDGREGERENVIMKKVGTCEYQR